MATFLADSELGHRRSREGRTCRRGMEPGREERQRSRSPQFKRLAICKILLGERKPQILCTKLPKMATIWLMTEVAKNGNK